MVKIQVDIDRLSDICQPKEVVIPDYWEGENYSFMLTIGKIRLNINAYSKKIISGTTSILLNLNRRLELDVFGADIDCRETNNWWGAGSPIGEEDVGTCGRPFRDWYGSWYDFFADVASYYKYNLTIKKGKLSLPNLYNVRKNIIDLQVFLEHRSEITALKEQLALIRQNLAA